MVALHVMPRFVNFGVQFTNPWDPRATLLFLKSNRLRHVLFPFARLQHCWYCCTVGFDMCIRRTRLFLSRVSILTRDIDIANLSVRPSVCPSVRNVPVSDKNGLTYGHSFFSPYGSPIILVLSASNIFTQFRRGHPLRGRKWGIKISRFSTNKSLYLANDTTYRHSYYGRRIGTRMRSIK